MSSVTLHNFCNEPTYLMQFRGIKAWMEDHNIPIHVRTVCGEGIDVDLTFLFTDEEHSLLFQLRWNN